MKLSPEQLTIASSTEPLLVVSAGPGSGKTTGGIIPRIAHLLISGVSPDSIALVAFTRTAALDLRLKIQQLPSIYPDLVGVDVDRIKVSTVHSLCLRYLDESGALRDGYRKPRMLLNHEKRRMLYDLEHSERSITVRESTLHAFEAAWITEVDRYPGRYIPLRNEASFEAEVWRWMLRHRCMIIGEVVPLAHREILNLPDQDVLPELEHLVVDEYQDLNGLEQAFIERLASRRNLVVVGDDDQSIYGFKFAHPQGIRSLVARAGEPGVEVVQMVECRRSPEAVVHAANSLMRTDYERQKPDMQPLSQRSGYTRLVSWSSQLDEAAGLATAIHHAVHNREVPIDQILVLVPNRIIGNLMVQEIAARGVPSLGYFDQDILDNNPKAWKAIALLDLLADIEDPLAWRMVWSDALKDPYDNAERYRDLIVIANEQNVSVEALFRTNSATIADRKFRQFRTVYDQTRGLLESLRGLSVTSVLDRLLPSDEAILRPLRLVAEEILSHDSELGIDKFVRAFRSSLAIKHLPESPEAVRVMTYHKSKGLTAGCVFVCGLIEGLISNISENQSPEDQQESRNEARRLLYVAMTRTSSDLVLSSFRLIEAKAAMSMGMTNLQFTKGGMQRTRTTRMLNQMGRHLGDVIDGEEFLEDYRQTEKFQPLA